MSDRGSLNCKCHLLQDEEEDVFKRDFSAPTLEDHFNKTILPKVMQVSLVTALEAHAFNMTSRPYSAILLFYLPSPLTFTPSPICHQVKNFGRSGRTKYTHLVDQDTTSFDSAWAQESAQNSKFFKQKAAGVRDVFDRPTVKKRKT